MEPPALPDDWERGLRTREIKAEEWEQYKAEIVAFYLNAGLKLRDVRRLILARHGFYATETQYKKRLSKVWKIEKNIPGAKMSIILKIEDRRKVVEGKRTVFTWHGQPIDEEKLDRSRKKLEAAAAQQQVAQQQVAQQKVAQRQVAQQQVAQQQVVGVSRSPVATPSYVGYWTPKNPTPVAGFAPRAHTPQPQQESNMAQAEGSPLYGYHLQPQATSHTDQIPGGLSKGLGIGCIGSTAEEDLELESEADMTILGSNFTMAPASQAYFGPVAYPKQSVGVVYDATIPRDPATEKQFGDMFFDQQNYNEALWYYDRALEGAKQLIYQGILHPDLLDTVHGIGEVYTRFQTYEKALHCYEMAYLGRRTLLGPTQEATLASIGAMAAIYLGLHDYGRALQCYNQELAGRIEVFGRWHPTTLKVMGCISTIRRQLGGYENADQWRFWNPGFPSFEAFSLGYDSGMAGFDGQLPEQHGGRDMAVGAANDLMAQQHSVFGGGCAVDEL